MGISVVVGRSRGCARIVRHADLPHAAVDRRDLMADIGQVDQALTNPIDADKLAMHKLRAGSPIRGGPSNPT